MFYIVPLLLFELKLQYEFPNDSLNFEDKLCLSNRYFLLYIDAK